MFIRASSAIVMFKEAIRALNEVPHNRIISVDMDMQNMVFKDDKMFNLNLASVHIRQGILKLEKTLDRDQEYLDAIKPNDSDPLPEP